MPQDRTRKIVITGVLGAISVFLGLTRWGFIPWFGGASLTIMHIPVIIGAILEGPVVGLVVGLIFGLFSVIQASMPNGIFDPLFRNPLISVLPRLFIGPVAWLVWSALSKALPKMPVVGMAAAGVAGSITNTVLVLGMIGILGFFPWAAIAAVATANGIPEAVLAGLLVVAVVAAYRRIRIGKRQGANL